MEGVMLPDYFQTALHATPDDTAAWSAAADWLLEQGREDGHEVIRWMLRNGRRPSFCWPADQQTFLVRDFAQCQWHYCSLPSSPRHKSYIPKELFVQLEPYRKKIQYMELALQSGHARALNDYRSHNLFFGTQPEFAVYPNIGNLLEDLCGLWRQKSTFLRRKHHLFRLEGFR